MPTVRAGDADIAYDVIGDGAPLLMIMGLAMDSRMWVLQTPAFSAQYRCVVLDNRGVGRSSSPPGPYTIEQMAADALAVLDDAGIERAHVLGISMGGAIAQHLALKAPERVRSLVLGATWAMKNEYLDRVNDLGNKLVTALGSEELTRALMLWLFSPRMFLEQPQLIAMIESMAIQERASLETFVAQTAACGRHDVREQLASLDVPTLVIGGTRDILVPPELSQQIAETIPGARLELLDAGHAINVEAMDRFNALVLEFLAEH